VVPLFASPLNQWSFPGCAYRKEVSMARLISIAAATALVLSAAFAAGLTCGG